MSEIEAGFCAVCDMPFTIGRLCLQCELNAAILARDRYKAALELVVRHGGFCAINDTAPCGDPICIFDGCVAAAALHPAKEAP